MKTVGRTFILISLVASQVAVGAPAVLPYIQRPQVATAGIQGGSNYVPNYSYNSAPATAPYRYNVGQQYNVGGGQYYAPPRPVYAYNSPFNYQQPRYYNPYQQGYYPYQYQQQNNGMFGGGLMGMLLPMLIGGGSGFMTGGMGGGIGGILAALMGGGGMNMMGNMGGMRFGNMNNGMNFANNNRYAYNTNTAANYQTAQAIPDLSGGQRYYGNTGEAVTPVGQQPPRLANNNTQPPPLLPAQQQAQAQQQVASGTDAIPDLTLERPQQAQAQEQTQPQQLQAESKEEQQTQTQPQPQQQQQPAPLVVNPSDEPEYVPDLSGGPAQPRSDVARSNDVVQSQQQPPVRRAPPAPRNNAVTTVPDTLTPHQVAVVRRLNDDERKAQTQPIWRPFYSRFKSCRPDCEPIGYHAKRPSAMCHGNGHAIDVFGMVCSDGSRHMAVNSTRDRGVFADLVACMAGPRPAPGYNNLRLKNGLGALLHNGHDMTDGHRNHAHFSIGCGRGVW